MREETPDQPDAVRRRDRGRSLRVGVIALTALGTTAAGAYALATGRIDAVTYAGAAVVPLALAALAGRLTAGRLLRPVRAGPETAQQTGRTDQPLRMVVTDQDGVAAEGRILRLDDTFASQLRFLDDAGHELRTPITILRGHLELLDVGDPASAAETRTLLLDELDRMSRLVEDLVLLGGAQHPDFLRIGPVDVAQLTDEVFDKAQALGPRRWTIDHRAETVIVADAQRLTEALAQLAENACKFTVDGDVVAIGSSADETAVHLWVRDTGSGIAPEDVERIFDRFERGGGARRAEGSGLGLAIVRAIAEAHGGHVTLTSRPGEGATFRLHIPRRAVPRAALDGLGTVDTGRR